MAGSSPIAQLGLFTPPLARASVAARVRACVRWETSGQRRATTAWFASRSALRKLRRGLDALQAHADVSSLAGRTVPAREAAPARALSTATLDLEPVATFTTLRSTEEVNAVPTSFTPFGPTVSGASTSEPTHRRRLLRRPGRRRAQLRIPRHGRGRLQRPASRARLRRRRPTGRQPELPRDPGRNSRRALQRPHAGTRLRRGRQETTASRYRSRRASEAGSTPRSPSTASATRTRTSSRGSASRRAASR